MGVIISLFNYIGTAGTSSITYIIAVVVIAICLFFFSRNYYGGMPWASRTDRAANFHKMAFECHRKGNAGKADRYYKKAQKLREKDFNFNF